MTKLVWGSKGLGSAYNFLNHEVLIGKNDIEEGKAPLALAHELAHIRQRHQVDWTTQDLSEAEEDFYLELAAWTSAVSKLPPEEYLPHKEFIEEALEEHLEIVADNVGKRSPAYKRARQAYSYFVNRYLRPEG